MHIHALRPKEILSQKCSFSPGETGMNQYKHPKRLFSLISPQKGHNCDLDSLNQKQAS